MDHSWANGLGATRRQHPRKDLGLPPHTIEESALAPLRFLPSAASAQGFVKPAGQRIGPRRRSCLIVVPLLLRAPEV